VTDADAFRSVMGRFATGVTVVTATGPDGPVGMTANAFCSLSLDPLLLLVCFDRRARTLPLVRTSERFGVNVLASGQEDLARRFASKHEGKFDEVLHDFRDGLPVLDGAIAWVACDLVELLPGGDHVIGIGSVTSASESDGEPLLWYRGAYGSLA
jgi:flavin reductase (DIM6/NTAB) family NADH-FMN oxidoreductase RutF